MLETSMQNQPLSSIVSRRSRNVFWILWVLIFSQYCSVWIIYHQAWLFESISLVLYIWYVWETRVNGFNVLANIRNTCLFKTFSEFSNKTNGLDIEAKLCFALSSFFCRPGHFHAKPKNQDFKNCWFSLSYHQNKKSSPIQ